MKLGDWNILSFEEFTTVKWTLLNLIINCNVSAHFFQINEYTMWPVYTVNHDYVLGAFNQQTLNENASPRSLNQTLGRHGSQLDMVTVK